MSAMATVDDALELITDPAYCAVLGRSTDDPVEMRVGEIVNKLRALGADDEIAARVLVAGAAARVGGRTGVEHSTGGNQAGGPAQRARFWLQMPRRALRSR